tara:strand:+ start:207 stop:458 length:252 start_codon:yes stop_codon:yes gene_type:complete
MKTIAQINKEVEKSFTDVKSRIVQKVIDNFIPLISEKVEDWAKDILYDISELEQVDHIDSIMDIEADIIDQCRIEILKRIKIK